MNGTQTAKTRNRGSGIWLKMLLCTQLAPARHVGQVGENISTSRGWPSVRLNKARKVDIWFGAMTRPLVAPRPAGAEAPGLLTAGCEVQDAASEPSTTAVAAAVAASRPEAATLPMIVIAPPHASLPRASC